MKSIRLLLCGILLCCNVAILHAGELEDVLHKHAEAMGGLDKLAAITTQTGYFTASYMGMPGKAEIYFSLPNKYYMKMNIGPMVQIIGCDGMTGWRVDDAGLVTLMTQAEMRPIVNALYFSSFSYVIPNRIKGQVEYRGTEDIAGTIYHKIVCFPEGGDSLIFKINDASGLIDYQISYESGIEMLDHIIEYRDVDGVKVPWEDSMIGRDTPIKADQMTDSIFFNRQLPDSIFSVPGQRGIDYDFADDADSIVLPITVSNDHVFLNVKINGQGPFTFLLDSGAAKTIIAKSLADRLHITTSGPIAMRGIGGFGSVSMGEIDSLSLGKLVLHIQRTMITDLSKFHSFDAGPLEGILGYDFFVRFPMTLDFKGKTLTLYNPDRDYRPKFANTLDAELYFQIPLITAKLDGHEAKMLFDLGAQTSILLFGRELIEKDLRDKLIKDSTTLEIMGVGGNSSVFISSLDSVTIGSEKIENPKIFWSDNAEEIPFHGYIEGIIGTGILSNYKVFLDYQRDKIGLDRGE